MMSYAHLVKINSTASKSRDRGTILLTFTGCPGSCTTDFGKGLQSEGVTKADSRISIKDRHRKENLKLLLFRPPFLCRQFLVRMNGAPCLPGGGPVSLTRLVPALCESLARAGQGGER